MQEASKLMLERGQKGAGVHLDAVLVEALEVRGGQGELAVRRAQVVDLLLCCRTW
jgi:hypothetical protein